MPSSKLQKKKTPVNYNNLQCKHNLNGCFKCFLIGEIEHERNLTTFRIENDFKKMRVKPDSLSIQKPSAPRIERIGKSTAVATTSENSHSKMRSRRTLSNAKFKQNKNAYTTPVISGTARSKPIGFLDKRTRSRKSRVSIQKSESSKGKLSWTQSDFVGLGPIGITLTSSIYATQSGAPSLTQRSLSVMSGKVGKKIMRLSHKVKSIKNKNKVLSICDCLGSQKGIRHAVTQAEAE